jgi:hypothetical protein
MDLRTSLIDRIVIRVSGVSLDRFLAARLNRCMSCAPGNTGEHLSRGDLYLCTNDAQQRCTIIDAISSLKQSPNIRGRRDCGRNRLTVDEWNVFSIGIWHFADGTGSALIRQAAIRHIGNKADSANPPAVDEAQRKIFESLISEITNYE